MREQRILRDRIGDAVLVKSYLIGIILNHSSMDAIITYDNSNRTEKTFRSFVKEIGTYNFNHSFMLLPLELINYIIFYSGTKWIKLFVITLDNK